MSVPERSTVGAVLRLCRPAAGSLALSVLAGVGAAGAAVGLMATSAWLISRAAQHPPVLHLMVAIVAVRAFGIGRGVLRYVERLTGHDAAFRVLGALRVRTFRRLERLAPAGLAGYRRGDLVARLVDDVESVLDVIVRVVLPITVAAVTGLGSVVLVAALLPAAGAALAAGLVIVGVGVPLLQSAAVRRADARLAPLRGSLTAGTVDLLRGLPDLVACGAVGDALAQLDRTDRALLAAARRSSATAGVSAAATALCTGLSVLAGLAAGAVAVRSGALDGELLAVVVLTPLAVFEIAGAVPAAAQRLGAARAALARLADIAAAADPAPDPARPRPVPPGPPTVRLEDVDAGWTPGRRVLHGVSLTLRPGRRVALVGPSGAGKSTVAALLVRWLDPCAGRVTLNGVDLRALRGDDVRSTVGYLGDDAYLFDSTIEANLRIGRPGATPAELESALAEARLLDWVRGLPQGLATPVGEHGMALSGGQRRRLALARALLADFPVLVLDEPTEHLDERTAAALTRDLLAATRGRTVLLITHRRTDLSAVDEVVELRSGSIHPADTAHGDETRAWDGGLVNLRP
ncbi:thiol reductant ABC exporter subunit CydC [Dactylosporangium roseum]|uniref:Thiol reductant ABC exporter subunit CydC n=1 Tax=Dactylosporangium roseum TaxID=47989 RepID=A0ABY5YWR9_9ACTN|nr:thiol reductant ABC exporter subunit CydC [Dactylosporangium roseum]UWZ33826.1 thiol reductant ABC exporter subunit CydC [Dactylosporangium roseum]